MKLNRILCASHGTVGARAAEQAALRLAQDSIYHLFIVPDFWQGMMGDDWLNNAVTRQRFGDYLESQIAAEAQVEIERFQSEVEQKDLNYELLQFFGDPSKILLKAAEQIEPDLIIIGSPRPKQISGLRSKLDCKKIMAQLNYPLWIQPYPND